MVFPSPFQLRSLFPRRPKLIVTDFDGTFVASGLTIPASTLKAYRRAIQAGYHIVIATGRSCSGASDILKMHGASDVSVYPGVYLNGCVTFGPDGPNDIVCETTLEPNIVRSLVNFVQTLNQKIMGDPSWQEDPRVKNAPLEHGFAAVTDMSLPPAFIDIAAYSRDHVVFTEENQLTHGCQQFRDGRPKYVGSILDYMDTHPINKLLVFTHSKDIIDSYRQQFVDIVGDPDCVTGGIQRMLEINPPGVNKARAIALLAERLGIALDSCVALGDGDNDFDMLKECALGFAMGNSSDALKRTANYVTENVNRGGWAQVVNTIVDAYTPALPARKCSSSSTEEHKSGTPRCGVPRPSVT